MEDTVEIENILNEDLVSRLIISSIPNNLPLNWDVILSFGKSKSGCISVIWRKYKKSNDEVHQLGSIKETYKGFITANVGDIREIKCENYTFAVKHDPSDNQGIHHIHIEVNPNIPSPSVRKRLRESLSRVFEKHPFIEYKS